MTNSRLAQMLTFKKIQNNIYELWLNMSKYLNDKTTTNVDCPRAHLFRFYRHGGCVTKLDQKRQEQIHGRYVSRRWVNSCLLHY